MPALIEEGRAKVNLTLRVVGRRVDGYHDLESVVAFADCADRLSLTPGIRTRPEDHRAAGAGLRRDRRQSGVQGGAIARRARARSAASASSSSTRVLPVAAGIGGGSADAAAALRLLAQLNGLALDDPRLIEVAQLTGADVPVCLASRACVMTGVGETLQPLSLPKMPCVMVNPCVAGGDPGRVQRARPAQRRIAGRRHRRDAAGWLMAGGRRVDRRMDRGVEASATISRRRRCGSSP